MPEVPFCRIQICNTCAVAYSIGHHSLADGAKVLREIHWTQCQRIDFADRVRSACMSGNTHVGASRNNVIFTSIFAEILQRSQCTRTFLNLIKEHQGICRDRNTCFEADVTQYPAHIQIAVKETPRTLIVHEVDTRHCLISCTPELLRQPRFARLTGASDNERLSISRRLPSLKLLHSRTIHDQSQSPTENVRVEPLFRTSYGGTTNDIHICRVKNDSSPW